MSAVNRWLSAITGKSESVVLQKEHLLCVVQRVSSDPSEEDTLFGDATHTLYITAYLSPAHEGLSFHPQSPRAILDVFVGRHDDAASPEWMRWSTSSLVYQHGIQSFTELFIKAATSKFNLQQPGLSLQMISWGRSVKVAALGLYPKTPQSLRFFQHTGSPIPRRNPCLYDMESPTLARSREISNADGSSDGSSDGSEACWEEESVFRSLNFGPPPSPKFLKGSQLRV